MYSPQINVSTILLCLFLIVMVIVLSKSTEQVLTCQEVLEMPAKKKLSFEELITMTPKSINDCLVHISKEPLTTQNALFIWKSLAQFYEGVPNIPEGVLAQLKWVTKAVTPEDYANITLESIDTVKNFGVNYNLDDYQLEAIAERVRQGFAGKSPEDYTYYDLKALNQILCAFNRSEIERIHPKAYKESVGFIGKLKNCPANVMTGFANLALHEDAFGPITGWTGYILKSVGAVAEYLPQVPTKLKKEAEAEVDEPGGLQES